MTHLNRRHLIQAVAGLGSGALWPARAARSPTDTPADTPFWRLLREGGCVVLMRHAQTVAGVGDPPGFQLGNCASQRNLSEAGREQARRLGVAFTRERVRVDEVRSSAWCRCTDTAQLAFGPHTVWAAINSFFRDGDGADATREVARFLSSWPAQRNAVLVTHQVNISALTSEFPAMGELFLLRADGARQGHWAVLARHVP